MSRHIANNHSHEVETHKVVEFFVYEGREAINEREEEDSGDFVEDFESLN